MGNGLGSDADAGPLVLEVAEARASQLPPSLDHLGRNTNVVLQHLALINDVLYKLLNLGVEILTSCKHNLINIHGFLLPQLGF